MTDEERRAIEADCERLIKRYVNLNDAQDWAAVAALYTEDAVFRRPSGGEPIVGREAILAGFLARPPRVQRHVIANVVVEVEDADHARAFCAIVLYMGDAAEGGGLPVQDPKSPLIGTFTDRLVRTAEGWRFAERVGSLDFLPGLDSRP
jgi:ketosteroid isomerase-like protein